MTTDDPEGINELLGLEEAAERYGIPLPQLRRRVVAGAIPGACTVGTEGGDEWRVAVASLVALGYRERRAGEAPDQPSPPQEPVAPDGAQAGTAEDDRNDDPHGRETGRPERLARYVEAERRSLERDRAMVSAARRMLEDKDLRLEAERQRLEKERQRLEKERRDLEDLCRALLGELTLLRSEREALDLERRQVQAERDE